MKPNPKQSLLLSGNDFQQRLLQHRKFRRQRNWKYSCPFFVAEVTWLAQDKEAMATLTLRNKKNSSTTARGATPELAFSTALRTLLERK